MKKILLTLFLSLSAFGLKSQTTNLAPGNYKSIAIQNYNANGDYTKVLILLHEAYLNTFLVSNYAIGTITALRGSPGAWHRVNIAELNTGSSYNDISASVSSIYNNSVPWKLKTCLFNGKKYLAVEVPYQDSHHDQGYKFAGWTASTGENMLAVAYMVNGAPVNQSVLSNIQDFVPNHVESLDVKEYYISGNVGIGTTDPKGYKLAVAGNMIAESVKVKSQGAWPDFVFAKSYALPTLKETENHIKEKGHLPGIPSAAEVKVNGVDLGDMNAKLLQKIEELTLHLINKEKEIDQLKLLRDKVIELDQKIMILQSKLTSND